MNGEEKKQSDKKTTVTDSDTHHKKLLFALVSQELVQQRPSQSENLHLPQDNRCLLLPITRISVIFS